MNQESIFSKRRKVILHKFTPHLIKVNVLVFSLEFNIEFINYSEARFRICDFIYGGILCECTTFKEAMHYIEENEMQLMI